MRNAYCKMVLAIMNQVRSPALNRRKHKALRAKFRLNRQQWVQTMMITKLILLLANLTTKG